MRALKLDLNPVTSARHNAAAAPANGTGVALAGYEGVLAVLDVVAVGGTTPVATYRLQESNDNSVFTDVSTANMLDEVQPVAFTAVGLVTRGYIGPMAFLRWALTVLTGTSPTVTASGTITLGYARHQPAGATQVP